MSILYGLIFNGIALQVSISQVIMRPEGPTMDPKTSSVSLGTLLHLPVPSSHLISVFLHLAYGESMLFQAGTVTHCAFVQKHSGALASAEPSGHYVTQSIIIINFVPCFLLCQNSCDLSSDNWIHIVAPQVLSHYERYPFFPSPQTHLEYLTPFFMG